MQNPFCQRALSERDIKAATRRSNRTLTEPGLDIQWQHSYISKDRTLGVYIAFNVRELTILPFI